LSIHSTNHSFLIIELSKLMMLPTTSFELPKSESASVQSKSSQDELSSLTLNSSAESLLVEVT